MDYYRTIIASPIGALTLVATDAALVAIRWEREGDGRTRLPVLIDASDHPVLGRAEAQLGAYFAGERRVFDLPARAPRLTTPAIGLHGVWVNGVQVADADGLRPDTGPPGRVIREFG